jgi:hypothetical protein
VPDHSTFSKSRHGRFRESDAFRHVFESVLRRCMSEGLVSGEGFAIDASVIKADANRARGVPGTEVIDWNKGDGPARAVREYLAALEANNPMSDRASDPPDPPTAPKNISLTDPAALWTAASGGPAFYPEHSASRTLANPPPRTSQATALNRVFQRNRTQSGHMHSRAQALAMRLHKAEAQARAVANDEAYGASNA